MHLFFAYYAQIIPAILGLLTFRGGGNAQNALQLRTNSPCFVFFLIQWAIRPTLRWSALENYNIFYDCAGEALQLAPGGGWLKRAASTFQQADRRRAMGGDGRTIPSLGPVSLIPSRSGQPPAYFGESSTERWGRSGFLPARQWRLRACTSRSPKSLSQ